MTTKLILAQADTLQKAGLRIMVERGEVAVGSTDWYPYNQTPTLF